MQLRLSTGRGDRWSTIGESANTTQEGVGAFVNNQLLFSYDNEMLHWSKVSLILFDRCFAVFFYHCIRNKVVDIEYLHQCIHAYNNYTMWFQSRINNET